MTPAEVQKYLLKRIQGSSMKRLFALLSLAILLFACGFERVTVSSVHVLCVVDNDTLNVQAGIVTDSALVCADVADSLSIEVP